MHISGVWWLAIGSALLTIGDIVFKYWLKVSQTPYYVGGIILYLGGLLCLVESFKSHNMAVASAVLVIGNILLLALVSWVGFGEPLTGKQMMGLGLAIASIVLMA